MRSFAGKSSELGQRVWCDPSAVLIGEISLGDDSSVWPLVSIRGDVNAIRIGQRSNIQDNSCLHVTHRSADSAGFPLNIGDDVTIGHLVMLHGCTIGNQVLVGMLSTILDGAVVEDQVMIGAGSLVPPNKVLESGHLYLGSPVKQIRKLTEAELAFLQQSANNYVELKNAYLNESDA